MDDEEDLQSVLDYPWITPTEDECHTPDARAAQAGETRQAITWDKEFRERLWRGLERRSLTPEHHRNDAVAALDDDSLPGWRVRWVFTEQDGKLVVRSLLVEAEDAATPAGGIDANLLRRLSPASAATTVAGLRQNVPDQSAQRLFLKWGKREAATSSEPRRRGRPELADDFLAEVALAYLRELPHGRGILRRVGLAVAPEPYSEANPVPIETVRDWVHKARVREFLSAAPKPGASGGEPGRRLLAILESGGWEGK